MPAVLAAAAFSSAAFAGGVGGGAGVAFASAGVVAFVAVGFWGNLPAEELAGAGALGALGVSLGISPVVACGGEVLGTAAGISRLLGFGVRLMQPAGC